MSAPLDAAIRERALDPHTSFIVQAPAGSGKTELLTRRVLTLLATVDEPEEVLAITFTRKAASEMRDRVVETLARAADPEAGEVEGHEAVGVALAAAVLRRDQDRDWQLLRNPARLNLRTIDSLATQLATRLPVVSALGAPSGVMDDAAALYAEAAARFLDDHLPALGRLLLQLGNRLDNAQSLLAGLLANRDQWKRYVYTGSADHDDMRGVLEAMLAELVESRMQALCASIPDDVARSLPALLDRSARYRSALADADDSGKLGREWDVLIALDTLPGSEPDDLPLWQRVREALLTAEGSVRKKLTRAEGCPTSKTDAELIGVPVDELKTHKAAFVEVLESIRERRPGAVSDDVTIAADHDFVACLVETALLPQPRYDDEQWALLAQLLDALPNLLLELQVVFSERRVVDFVEMAERAQRALGTDESPTDLALAMDLRLRHLLVDEFQDTSRTQFALFERLVAEWTPGDGRTVFAVGDPMQAIYRFRDGDVALFGEAQRRGVGPVRLESLTLETSFRAAPAVVDWINETFSAIFPAEADPDVGAVPYSPSRAHLETSGQVQVHPFIDADSEAEAAAVARLAAEAGAGDDSHSVAILLRSRRAAVPIFAALRRAGVAYRAIDMDLLGERPVVRDLLALCLALRYPHDRLHWLALLRSPCAGLTLADLHALMRDSKRDAVIDLLRDPARLTTLGKDGQRRALHLLEIIEPAVRRAPRAPIVPWVEACWLRLGGPAVCRDTTDLDAAERCIARLQVLENEGQLYQRAVLSNAMQALYAAPLAEARVQVMTLHKAKGLEFDTVILPSLERKAGRDGARILDWFESTIDDEPRLLLAPIEERNLPKKYKHGINRLVREARTRCDRQEDLRLMYVACTRAKQALHLLGRAKAGADGELRVPPSGTLLAPLWPRVQERFVAVARDGGVSKDESPGDTANGSLNGTGNGIIAAAANGVTGDLFDEEPAWSPLLQRLPAGWRAPTMSCYQASADAVASAASSVAEDEGIAADAMPWKTGAARDVGTVVHRQLLQLADRVARCLTPSTSVAGVGATSESSAVFGELLGDVGAGMESVARRQLRNLGVPERLLDEAVERVSRAMTNVLEDDRGRWILMPHADARSEWSLTTVEGAQAALVNVIIDRSFVDADGTRWIIDFKTADHEGGNRQRFLEQERDRYAPQLQRYADIIRRSEDRPVRVGLYFPMLRDWCEWEPGA